ncbi:MAG: hypothetical protein M3R21_03270, partial [Candidatus Dormibacteraeota bacterium]|nr:hypothetical protein [Candidatus Dormibacteraeota bacterium]
MTGRLMVALAVVAVVAGCTSGGTSSKTPAAPGTSQGAASNPVPSPSTGATLPPYHPTIDPSNNFTDQITNPYFPLKPGTTLVFEGKRDDVPRRTEMTITRETKMIMGVKCIVVRDVLTTGNALVEKTVDWYAQDTNGNVWYFGEDTAEYVNGAVSSTAGTWLAGVDGALPGIVMEAFPKVGDAYRQEYRPGVAEDFAKVQKIDASITVPVGTYSRAVVTEDTDLLDKTKLEHKSYAPNIGFVASEGMVNG